jgi:hypothetical protein
MNIPTTPGTLGRARTWIMAAVALAALTLVAFAPSAAQAAAGKKPKCVEVEHTVGTITQTVTVKNHCPRATVSFVIHKDGLDSPCLHAAPGRSRGMKWPRPATYQGTSFGCD